MRQRKRAIITAQEACEIFLTKSSSMGTVNSLNDQLDHKSSSSRGSVVVSGVYGISPKAVRDIWNG